MTYQNKVDFKDVKTDEGEGEGRRKNILIGIL